ncbi:hypothetical protein [Streptomyces phaeofaciens]
MSDAEWARVRDLLPVPGWLADRDGRPEELACLGHDHFQLPR